MPPTITFPDAVQLPHSCVLQPPAPRHGGARSMLSPCPRRRDVHGLPRCTAGVPPALPSPQPQTCSRSQRGGLDTPHTVPYPLLPREQPRGDTWWGTRVYLCTVAAATARPAQLGAHTTGSSSPPPPMSDGENASPELQESGRCIMGPRGARCCGSLLVLWRDQSLQEGEQVCRELLGDRAG